MRSSRPNSRLRITLISTVVVVSLVILLQITGLWRPIRVVFDVTTQPITRLFSGIGRSIGGGFSTLASLGTISKENTDLRRELTEQKADLAKSQEIERENELLRAQLNFSKNSDYQQVGARVVGYSPDNMRRTLTIDRGKKDGLEVGQAVMSSGALIGRIEEVNDMSSQVFLVGDPEFRVQAISQSGRARGILRGELGEGLRFEQVAQNESLQSNEFVLTAGSELIPKGILIGTIESIDRSDNEIFQAANVRPAADYRRVEVVFVVKG